MPPHGKRCLEAPKHMAFFLELQLKHLQEIAEFQRMTELGMAALRQKHNTELDAAIAQNKTHKEQHNKQQKCNSYNSVPPPASLTSEELTCGTEKMNTATPEKHGGEPTVARGSVPTSLKPVL
jgi:hypothetical protein